MKILQTLLERPLLGAILRHRFIKFGSVGFSGTLVNLGVLYVAQEVIFSWVDSSATRLNLSLALAIFCATLNNFTWNRLWTWGDRRESWDKNLFVQFGQYFVTSWFSIVMQFVFTNILVRFFYYLIANLIAIGLAGVFNYLVNNAWAFGNNRSLPRDKENYL